MTRARAVLLGAALAAAGAIAPGLLGGSCAPGYPGREMLRTMAYDVILATYVEFTAAAGSLEESTGDLCTSLDAASLSSAQAAWDAARAVWKRTDAFAFGPYELEPWRIGPKVDSWPVRTGDVDDLLAGSAALDGAAVSMLGTNLRGLPVLETFFNPVAGDAAVLAAFGGAAGPRRCTYAAGLGADLATLASEMEAAWRTDGDRWAADLARAGLEGSTYRWQREAIALLVNQLIVLLENLRDRRLGAPAGLTGGGEPLPDEVESRFANRSLQDALDELDGLEALYVGPDGGAALTGLGGYVRYRDAAIDAVVLERLAAARAAITAVPAPLRTAVTTAPAAVAAARDAVDALHLVIAVDVANAVGATLTFSGNDGD